MTGSLEPVFLFLTDSYCSLAMTSARLGGKKIPERSEDDFFPANQPVRAALHQSLPKGYLCSKKWNNG